MVVLLPQGCLKKFCCLTQRTRWRPFSYPPFVVPMETGLVAEYYFSTGDKLAVSSRAGPRHFDTWGRPQNSAPPSQGRWSKGRTISVTGGGGGDRHWNLLTWWILLPEAVASPCLMSGPALNKDLHWDLLPHCILLPELQCWWALCVLTGIAKRRKASTLCLLFFVFLGNALHLFYFLILCFISV